MKEGLEERKRKDGRKEYSTVQCVVQYISHVMYLSPICDGPS